MQKRLSIAAGRASEFSLGIYLTHFAALTPVMSQKSQNI
jgi:hypothetical protein